MSYQLFFKVFFTQKHIKIIFDINIPKQSKNIKKIKFLKNQYGRWRSSDSSQEFFHSK